jgi:hypothetical protein
MKIPVYITADEVKRVCKELKIRDWTRLKKPSVLEKEARIILKKVNTGGMKIDLKDFQKGLEVELEHGTEFKDANVTNNHPIVTGKIVLAHMKEFLDYYKRLEVTELEGDLYNAIQSGNIAKIRKYYQRLARAKLDLSIHESKGLR